MAVSSPSPNPTAALELRQIVLPGRTQPRLDGVSLRIEAGQTAAIVGATGSGKSTLIGLLARLHEPPRGTVFVDGVDVRTWPLARLRGAIGFETLINTAQQEVLNPEGINCFRYFEGRGMRLWGARTISSDPEWKYLNVRRYFAYLERSIDKGTQWAVFEPNGEQLWANVRRTIEDFLLNEWQSGALLGDKPEKAYFVRCDRSTMTQNDLDNGRLICLIGVAPLRPAEFVIFRIGQFTADRKA